MTSKYNMTVTIHQPEHMIWLGLVDKIRQADAFVVLDNVQFRKNYFQNRNKIRTKDSWTWLTVPVKKHSLNTPISEIEISYTRDWIGHYLDLLKIGYGGTKFFSKYFPEIEKVILKRQGKLSLLNIELIKFVLDSFKIMTKIEIASILLGGLPKKSTENLIDICVRMKADRYLAGKLGKEYMDMDAFKPAGIDVVFHEFSHPVYEQAQGGFLPEMTSLDMLFNCGPGSGLILSEEKGTHR